MFRIDDRRWPWPCDIERVAELRPSEVSGLLLDRNYFNDVLGTYMSYTVTAAIPLDRPDDYAALYDLLSDPADGHVFELPYDQGAIALTGRVERVSDVYARLPGGGVMWKGLRFTIVANHPSRAYTLAEAVSRGRAPVPAAAHPEEGDTYTWYEGRWSKTAEYADADVIRY